MEEKKIKELEQRFMYTTTADLK